MDKYKTLIEQVHNSFIRSLEQTGLDYIIKKIKPKYVLVNDPRIKGGYDTIRREIRYNKAILDKYFESNSLNEALNSFLDIYWTGFHELTHYLREKVNKYYLKEYILGAGYLITSGLLVSLSSYLLPISIILGYESLKKLYKLFYYDRTEEIVTEALTIIFLSKLLGKQAMEEIVKINIGPAWGDATPTYSDGKYIYYLYFKDIKYLEYDLGRVLGYLLLKVNEDKQKEYVRELLGIYKRKDLKKLIYDLWNYIPKDEETIRYYNLVKNFVEGKAIIPFVMINGKTTKNKKIEKSTNILYRIYYKFKNLIIDTYQ